ncbi:hypothetical protein [Haloimpatiens massiliensis]|uniref:hypothetical protein n=1 Tax=Haloimpatiens massiliensis TaxID=1658110 RepID=UPI000C829EF2|nr:hypothetical protein [Haloimpatiens massiliensis]
MKKLVLAIIMGAILILSGCGEAKSKDEKSKLYNDNGSIVKEYDSFNYFFRDSEGEDSNFKMSFKTFSGTDTIMKIDSDGKEELNLTYDIKVNKGKVKLVFINPEDKIEVIVEGKGKGNYKTTLESGKYRVKAVGAEAKGNLEIKANTNAKVVVKGEE